MGQGGKIYGIIVAGGRGKRMGPFTDTHPKALYPILGKPIIVHQILQLKEAGITDIVISEGYLADQIHEVLGDGSNFGVEIQHFVETDYQTMGNAGVIKRAMKRLNLSQEDKVVVVFGDIYSDINIRAALQQHRETKADITLINIPHTEPLGVCRVNEETGRVEAFVEKPNEASSGFYIFSEQVLDCLPDEGNLSVDVLMPLINNHQLEGVYAYLHDEDEGFWYHITTEEDVFRINSDLGKKKEDDAGRYISFAPSPEIY